MFVLIDINLVAILNNKTCKPYITSYIAGGEWTNIKHLTS